SPFGAHNTSTEYSAPVKHSCARKLPSRGQSQRHEESFTTLTPRAPAPRRGLSRIGGELSGIEYHSSRIDVSRRGQHPVHSHTSFHLSRHTSSARVGARSTCTPLASNSPRRLEIASSSASTVGTSALTYSSVQRCKRSSTNFGSSPIRRIHRRDSGTR